MSGGRPPVLTLEQVRQIREDFDAGFTVQGMAWRLGVSRQTVSAAIYGVGTYADIPGGRPRPFRRRFTGSYPPSVRARAMELRDEGHSYEAIAYQLGDEFGRRPSFQSVRAWCKGAS